MPDMKRFSRALLWHRSKAVWPDFWGVSGVLGLIRSMAVRSHRHGNCLTVLVCFNKRLE